MAPGDLQGSKKELFERIVKHLLASVSAPAKVQKGLGMCPRCGDNAHQLESCQIDQQLKSNAPQNMRFWIGSPQVGAWLPYVLTMWV